MKTVELSPEQIEVANKMIADAFQKKASALAIEQADEREMTRAERRMAARRKKRPDLVQPVEIIEGGESEIWYLPALSDADVSSIGILMAGDGFTLEDLSSEQAQRSFNAALLCVGLAVSETDSTKYFEDISEAKDFYDDPRNAGTSMALRTQIMELNPFFFGSKKNAPTIRILPKQSAGLLR